MLNSDLSIFRQCQVKKAIQTSKHGWQIVNNYNS